MYIKRKLEGTILKYLKSPEIIAVVGPRQSGKTTMVKKIIQDLPKAISVSFDDQNILTLFEKHTDEFITAYVKGNKFLFIDEFQYAKNGGKNLKYIFDKEKIKIIISGSSVVDLTVKAVRYLVGRVFVFTLHPFDFEEYLSSQDTEYLKLYLEYKGQIDFKKSSFLLIPPVIHDKFKNYYAAYLRFGGYPRVVLADDEETKKETLRNVYNTFFLREVRDVLGLIDDYKLSSLIKGLALQAGNLIEYNELSRLTGFSFASLKKYLNFLEKTYICDLIRPFYKNKRTEIVKNPKVYFLDSGLRNAIINDFRRLDERTDSGAFLENGLAMQLIKNNFAINFWRDKKKNEVDFVLTLENGILAAIEVKSYLKNTASQALKVFSKTHADIKFCFGYWDKDQKLSKVENLYPIYLF